MALKAVNTFLSGSVALPGDKSVSHRAIIFPALLKGRFKISGALASRDCLATLRAMEQIGLDIKGAAKDNAPSPRADFTVESPGLSLLAERLQGRDIHIDCGNSGTTMRLISGLAAGLPATFVFDGDSSLRRRDMRRILKPLAKMGARVEYLGVEGYAPFKLTGGKLKGANFSLDIDSAQVSTALLLAGLQARGSTRVRTRHVIRDHTPRLLEALGLPVKTEADGLTISVDSIVGKAGAKSAGKNTANSGAQDAAGGDGDFELSVPADLSSAAFYMVAASLLPGSLLVLPNCGVNPGRRLIIDSLRAMGASIELTKERNLGFEPVADIVISYSDHLSGIALDAHQIASGIDELPVLSLAFAFAQGISEVTGAAELAHKESDRLTLIARNLAMLGAIVECSADGFAVLGGLPMTRKVGVWQTEGDHRLAMTGLIAQLICGGISVDDLHCVDISYPGFERDLASVSRRSAH